MTARISPFSTLRIAPGTANGRQGVHVRLVATALLVAMAILFVVTTWFRHIHPAVGFVRAFAEAAMVGGLADWFAVSALFRHPLGLPIPHTAIIPRNKDRIGDTLAIFLKDNFLIPAVIARRMRHVDVAGAAGRFLAAPTGGEGRIRQGASRLVADALGSLDPTRLGPMVKGALTERVRAVDFAPLAGQALQAAMAEDRHVPVLNGAIGWLVRLLEDNEAVIRAIVHERSNAIMRWTGIDGRIANSIVTGLHKMLGDMADDPDHPLRQTAEDKLRKLAYDLQHEPAMRGRVMRLRDELLENPAVARWFEGLWEQARQAMIRSARDPDAMLAGRLGEILQQMGTTLQRDEQMKRTLNRFIRRTTVGAVANYGDNALRLVSDTVRGWDAATVTDRLESAVGKDLQYIRINGTVVGGLVGVAIHIVDHFLGS